MPAPARPLVALAAIALAEGVALVAYGVFDLVQAVRVGATGPADVSNWPAIVLQIVLFAVFGAGLAWVARGWWGARQWARAPFLLAQLLALVVGIPLAQSADGSARVAGIALALAAVVGIVLALSPGTATALED